MAIVETQTMKTWRDLFFQRVRWASKTANYTSFYAKQLGLSVFFMNFTWLLVTSFFLIEKVNISFFAFFTISKLLIDFILLYRTSSFFKTSLRYLIFGSLVYPLFSVFVVLYSVFGKYEWKGRRFKK